MQAIINFFTGTLNTVAWLYIFLPCTILGGLYLTIRNRGIQFTKFGYTMKNTLGKMFQKQEAGSGAVTPVQAVTTALAATVGTGNIVGTSQAIALGGYGAVFWLWLAALLGMMIKYSEVVLSIRFRERDAKGDWVGGPMYYVKNGLGKGWQWVGILFAVFAAIACFGIGNMSQVNSIVGSLNNAIDAFIPAAEGERNLLNLIFGIAIAALVALILFGGIKRIGAVAEKLIPFMSVLYIVFAIVVVFAHAGNIGPAFAKIFSCAFTPGAVGGAAAGIALKQTIIWGLRRSAFSNEAGLGSAAIAHAAADTKGPVQQGLYGIFEVFAGRFVVVHEAPFVLNHDALLVGDVIPFAVGMPQMDAQVVEIVLLHGGTQEAAYPRFVEHHVRPAVERPDESDVFGPEEDFFAVDQYVAAAGFNAAVAETFGFARAKHACRIHSRNLHPVEPGRSLFAGAPCPEHSGRKH